MFHNTIMAKVFFIIYLLFLDYVSSYKILGIFPYKAKSHYAVFDPLMVELANRGHHVTVYNTFPKDYNIKNYYEINIEKCFPLPEILTVDQMATTYVGAAALMNAFRTFVPTEQQIMNCKLLTELTNSTEKYDAFITETFLQDFFQLFGHRLKIPVITFHSNAPLPWMSNQLGLPENPSYIPHAHEAFPEKMSFVERLQNTLCYLGSLVLYQIQSEASFDDIARRYFGPSVPSLQDVVKNVSLLLLYTHFSLNRPRPLVPGTVEVAGLNLKPARRLPENIEKFINESTHGVVYFCMGSLLRGETFPAEKRDAFLYAFSKIPQRVLWKWEGEVLPGKSENIMTSKWMPQRDILAHPNVKLFISHGGLLGTSEAVYEGVPVIGIPIFGDQRTNIKALEANGAGELLDYNDISGEVVLEKIQRLINDPKYKESARQLSIRYKDRPMSPLDTAVYWTEYVIRHKGAPHLKTAAVDMPWYQYLLLDVIAFLIFILVSVILIIYYGVKISLRYLCALIFGNSSSLKPTKKVKDN